MGQQRPLQVVCDFYPNISQPSTGKNVQYLRITVACIIYFRNEHWKSKYIYHFHVKILFSARENELFRSVLLFKNRVANYVPRISFVVALALDKNVWFPVALKTEYLNNFNILVVLCWKWALYSKKKVIWKTKGHFQAFKGYSYCLSSLQTTRKQWQDDHKKFTLLAFPGSKEERFRYDRRWKKINDNVVVK